MKLVLTQNQIHVDDRVLLLADRIDAPVDGDVEGVDLIARTRQLLLRSRNA